jgi:hypothetical protein
MAASPGRRRLRYAFGYLMVGGGLAAGSAMPSGDEILARLDSESDRRRVQLKEYSGSRQ